MGDDFNLDQARYNRANQTQKPDFAPGMESDPFGSSSDPFASSGSDPFGNSGSDPFGNSSGGLSSMGGGDPFASSDPFGNAGSSFGGGGMMNSFAGMNGGLGGQQPVAQKAPEDKFFDALKAIGIGIKNVSLDIVKSFSKNDIKFYNTYFLRVALMCAACAILFGVACLFGFPGLYHIIAMLICGGLSFGSFMFTFESANNYTPPAQPEQPTFEQDPAPAFDMSEDFSDAFADDPFGDEDEDDYVEETQEDVQVLTPNIDFDSIIDNLPDLPEHMYKRSFLFEQFCGMLNNITQDYAKMNEFDEDSEPFLRMNEYINETSEVLGLKSDAYPMLISYVESKFGVIIEITRPPKFNEDKFGSELCKLWADRMYNEDDKLVAKTFYRTRASGKHCKIFLFSGSVYLLSVKDLYTTKEVRDFVLNEDIELPVVIGIDETGKAQYIDFAKVYSMIMAGMPRSGKTWALKSMLVQLVALNSPNRVNIILLDPKGPAGDWARFLTPHVKHFGAQYRRANGDIVYPEYESILSILEWLSTVEAPRRKKLIGDAGVPSMREYRKLHPDEDEPTLYIVIDEMVTLSEQFKDDYDKYVAIINEIVTQYPNLDIIGLFTPHRITNKIIPKTTSDAIKNKVSVNGDKAHIETTTETTNFPYKIANPGDMALRFDPLNGGTTVYSKAAVISKTNPELDNVVATIGKLWKKYEPDSVNDSLMNPNRDNKLGIRDVDASQTVMISASTSSSKPNAPTGSLKPAGKRIGKGNKSQNTFSFKAPQVDGSAALNDFTEGKEKKAKAQSGFENFF